MPISVGAALGMKRQGRDAVVVCYSGDGAIVNGAAHEALNMASLWTLPVIFVRVNNQYAESTPTSDYLGIPDVVAFAGAYGLRAERVDGNDVEAVADAAERAVTHGRAGEGATFLEMVTYRKYGHNIGDTGAARPPDEVAHWLGRDPIDLVRAKLSEHGVGQARLEAIDAAVAARLENAIDAAAAMPEPPEEWAFEDVYGDRDIVAAIGGRLR